MFSKYLLFVLNMILVIYSPGLFSQNLKMDGYKGIWFSSGEFKEYGYRLSGGAATFASRHKPIAIYSPEVKKTFFVYGGTTDDDERHLLIMASYFDHRFHKVPKPVIVFDKMGVTEPGDNASLSIDNKGYLWIFVSGSGRTRPGLIFKSSEPWSIEKFDRILEWEMLAPQAFWMENFGFLMMFSRAAKGLELYFTSSSDGNTWNGSQKIASMGGHMQVAGINNGNLVTVFNYHPGGNLDKRTNLYLLQTKDLGKTWETIDGNIIRTPVTDKGSECLIKDFESEGRLVYLNDLNFDREGNPVILAILSRDVNPGPAGDPREWMIIHWKDKKWNFNKVCESTHNYDMGSLYITEDDWRIIGPTEPGPQKYGAGGEIALWISRDEGISWEKARDITINSLKNNTFVRRPQNAQKDFFAFWTDGDADKLSVSRLYYTNAKCKKVWVLPYEMEDDLAKPVRIR